MNKATKIFNESGFNPYKREGFGSGLMCGILFIFDLPMTIIAIIVALFGFKIRSFGFYALCDMMDKSKSNLGKLIAFIFFAGNGIACWFNKGLMYGTPWHYQTTLIYISIVFALLALIATTRAYKLNSGSAR